MAIRDKLRARHPVVGRPGTSDADAAKEFYGALFGWTFEDMPMADDGTIYSMASLAARRWRRSPRSSRRRRPPACRRTGSMYITVDDVDDAAAKVADAGGTVHAGPFDVMDAGRMAVVQDPVGAFVMLWQPKGTAGVGLVNEDGGVHLGRADRPERGVGGAVLRDRRRAQAGASPTWATGGSTPAGRSTAPTRRWSAGRWTRRCPGIPPHWSIYFGSDDVDADAAKTKELGGSVIGRAVRHPRRPDGRPRRPPGRRLQHLLRPRRRELTQPFLRQRARRLASRSADTDGGRPPLVTCRFHSGEWRNGRRAGFRCQ